MSAVSYRDELEALLRRAEKDGYRFSLEYEIDSDGEPTTVNTDYFFMNVHDYTDHATVDSGLIWESEI